MSSPLSYPLTERQPDERVALVAGEPVSVGRFIADACELATALPKHRYIVNLQVDRFAYLLCFYAGVIAGNCTLMPPNRQSGTLSRLRSAYPDSYVIDEDFAVPTSSRAAVERNDYPDIPGEQLCAIAFTSGSTGEPKPNFKYWHTLVGGGASNRKLLIDRRDETVSIVATVPPQHMWGLEMSILLPMFGNAAVCNRTPFFPGDFADLLAAVPEPRALVSTPVHLDALVKSGVDLPALWHIYTATAPLSAALAMALEERFSTTVTEVFGCSETGILARRRTTSETDWRLADAFDLQAAHDGARVTSPHLPEAVVLPDVIELSGERQFRWLGRQQDMINIAGKRGSLAELNLRLCEIPGVEDGVIFAPGNENDRLAALVVAPGLREPEILAQLKTQIEPAFLPRPLYRVDKLPRQATGKLPAREVQAQFDALRQSRG